MRLPRPALMLIAVLLACTAARAGDLVPPRQRLAPDRPRLLLRPGPTKLAITPDRLAAVPRDVEFNAMLGRLAASRNAACQALLWRLTGEKAAAERALQRLLSLGAPDRPDSFAIYFRLREAALAYDWLHGFDGLSDAVRAEIRADLAPLASAGQRAAGDHVFHNYTWMAAGGAMLWALATAGDDAASDALFDAMRTRLNDGLYPAMEYLNGLHGESPGYWTLYDLTPCALTVLAAQSAFESDLALTIRRDHRDWLARQLDGVILTTLPNMRFVTWGDIQSGGDGGATHEVAGVCDALTWATGSPGGAFWGRWLAQKRGLPRFHDFHMIFYFLYTRNLAVEPAEPPLSFLAGSVAGGMGTLPVPHGRNTHAAPAPGDPGGGTVIARSDWTDGATVVAFRCTDHYGSHNHFDQGSFFMYRNGHLAVDPDLYRKVGGPQQPTDVHSTLLIGGQGQRPVRGQWFGTVAEFQRNLTGGARLETGDILYYAGEPAWTAVAGQFAQAYRPDQVSSCVRQLLFVRPDTVVVVDRLTAPPGGTLGEVTWQLMLAAEPQIDGATIRTGNGRSGLVCRTLLGEPAGPSAAEASIQKSWRTATVYKAAQSLTLVHWIQVGEFDEAWRTADATGVAVKGTAGNDIEIAVGGRTFVFAGADDHQIKVLKLSGSEKD